MESSTLGAVGKISVGKLAVSKFPNFNLENHKETKVKTSTSLADYQDKAESIKHFVNHEITPTAYMRKVGIDVNETHLGRKN